MAQEGHSFFCMIKGCDGLKFKDVHNLVEKLCNSFSKNSCCDLLIKLYSYHQVAFKQIDQTTLENKNFIPYGE